MRDIVSPLAGFSSPFGRGADPYAILGYKPPLVLDYENSKFRVSGSTSTAPSVVTATRTGLATQMDASGNLVWNAHNLLLRSEEFDGGANWLLVNVSITANQIDSPDNTLTADLVEALSLSASSTGIYQTASVLAGIKYNLAVWVKAGSVDKGYLQYTGASEFLYFDLATQSVSISGSVFQSGSVVDAGNGWYLVSATYIPASDNAAARQYLGVTNTFEARSVVSGDSLYFWGAHLYRSDLGGMASVPLTRRVAGSTTYVPTTSAAVYLPREEAYTYVSGSLVGPYYQKESDARTNLITYSEDFTDASWIELSGLSAMAAPSEVGIDGETSASVFQRATTTGVGLLYDTVSITSDATYTLSFYVKQSTHRYVAIALQGTTSEHFATAVFDVGADNSGATETDVGTTSGTILSTNQTDAGNGFYRISLTCSLTQTSAYAWIGFAGSATGNTFSNTGQINTTWELTDKFIATAAQLEAGSTPTSYIPTSGSTVTRSADSTTISAANMPYPTPQVIGPELVTNGTFDTDSDWTKGTGWTISGGVATANTTNQGEILESSSQWSGQNGKVYRVTATVTMLSTPNSLAKVRINVGGIGENIFAETQSNLQSGVTYEINSVVVPSTASTFLIRVGSNANYAMNYTIDNISVREINPLALSFQMEGLVTFADTDNGQEVVLSNWELSPSNYIMSIIRTNSTIIGQAFFDQNRSGDRDFVASASDYYSPGINVPFNIASRHGSTFINGAVDGTALTADLTPTALPDLSATTFDLAPTFNGFIKEFRVWADDIGDSGIAEAST